MGVAVSLAPAPILQFLNNLGQLNVGGTLRTQVGGLDYPAYEDAAGTIALPNPIQLNSRGEISNASGSSRGLFLVSGINYTLTLKDAFGNQIWQIPNIIAGMGSSQAGFVDIRTFGASEGANVTVNTAALAAAIAYVQANYPIVVGINIFGNFSFDPTLLPYVAAGGINNVWITQQTPFLTLKFGGTATWGTPFYVPGNWSCIGYGSNAAAQFSIGAPANWVGDVICAGYGAYLRQINVQGQMYLAGHTPSIGQDALVDLDNCSVTLQGSRATSGTPALYIYNKYSIRAKQLVVQAIGTNLADPTTAIKVQSNFETGLTRIRDLTVSFGSIDIDVSAGGTNFQWEIDGLLSESLTKSSLFNITGAANASSGILDIRQAAIGDNQVASPTLVNLVSGQFNSLKLRECSNNLITNMSGFKYLDMDPGIFFEYSTIDTDLTKWRPTQNIRNGNACQLSPGWMGMACAPGYVKPSYKPCSNAPTGAGWTTNAGQGFDTAGPSYSRTVAAGPFYNVHDLGSLTTPSMSVNDVLIFSCWIQRQDQTNIPPVLNLNMYNTGTGLTVADAFSGGVLVTGYATDGRLAGYNWLHCFVVFKVPTATTYWPLLYWSSFSTAGTFVMSDPVTTIMTGNPTFYDVWRMLEANMRYPSLISSGANEYFSLPPGARLAMHTDTAWGAPQQGAVGCLAGNVIANGSGATGSRPTPVSGNWPKGYQWFDTTINKPIFADGAGGWKDAAGTGV